jgi:hypothetical protein
MATQRACLVVQVNEDQVQDGKALLAVDEEPDLASNVVVDERSQEVLVGVTDASAGTWVLLGLLELVEEVVDQSPDVFRRPGELSLVVVDVV